MPGIFEMDPSVFQSRLKASVGGPELWDLRRETALHTAKALSAVGRMMASRTDLTDDIGDAVRAMGALLQMAGELAFAAGRMLSGDEHYAGAALVRQIVEIEYLTWTFKEGHESVTAWLTSTYEERMKVFSPKQLRANSKGRFLFKDYHDHCEQGGHPVPRGIFLLGSREVGVAQVMLVDLLVHCWRTWDQVRSWSMRLPIAQQVGLPGTGVEISQRLYEWGRRDPTYALMVELHPEPAPAP
jgi:hypothetical protein